MKVYCKYNRSTILLYKIIEFILYAFVTIAKRRFFPKHEGIKKILLIEPYQLGDLVSLSVLIDPIRRKFPEGEIFVLCKTSNMSVFKNDYRIKQTFGIDFPWTDHGPKKIFNISRWRAFFFALHRLSRNCFSIGFDTRGDILTQFVLRYLRVKEIVGYTSSIGSNLKNFGLLLDVKVPRSSYYVHRYESNAYLLVGLGFNIEEIFPLQFPIYHGFPNIATRDGAILIHIGGGWIYRQWKIEKWVSLIRMILGSGKADVVVIGGQGEKELIDNIKSIFKGRITAKVTSFDEMVAEIQMTSFFIGVDSGPLHIADSLDKAVLGLFGAGISDIWYPYSRGSVFIQKIEKYPCHPCIQRSCIFPENNCMDSISVFEVYDTFMKMYSKLNN